MIAPAKLVEKRGYKYLIFGFPRFVRLATPGHLSECLLVELASTAEDHGDPWPPEDLYGVHCTCDDWSPE